MADQFETDTKVVRTTASYINEATQAGLQRLEENRKNFACYHLNQDFKHKTKGQSTEFLPKLFIAVEQLTSFIQQGLMDPSGFYRIELTEGAKKLKEQMGDAFVMDADVIKLLLDRQFQKVNFPEVMADGVKMALLGSLSIVKTGGKRVKKIRFDVEADREDPKKKTLKRYDDYVWQLDINLVRHEDYLCDPTGAGLYEGCRIDMDLHALIETAENNPEEGYDLSVIKALEQQINGEQEAKKARETGQTQATGNVRRRVEVYEFYGTLLDPDTGLPMVKDGVRMTNVVWAVANKRFVIRPPTPNRLWHGESPYVVAPIIRVPHSTWHKALMDASRDLNFAMNELFNLMLDGGIMAVHGVKQLRTDLLVDEREVAGGIRPGSTLQVSAATPPGTTVVENCVTGKVPQESVNVMNLVDKEFQGSSLSSDVRSGVLPQRQVKATEIVQVQQGLTSLFRGVVKILETRKILLAVIKSWLTTAQFMDDLDDDEVVGLLGTEKARRLATMSREERFQQAAAGFKFEVFGMSSILNKMNDFKKLTAFLQTVSSSDTLLAEALKQVSLAKLIAEIIKALDLPIEKLKVDEGERERVMAEAQQRAEQQKMAAPQGRIPQAGASRDEQEVQVDRSGMLAGGITRPGG